MNVELMSFAGSLAAALHAAGPVVVDVHGDPRADASTAGRNA